MALATFILARVTNYKIAYRISNTVGGTSPTTATLNHTQLQGDLVAGPLRDLLFEGSPIANQTLARRRMGLDITGSDGNMVDFPHAVISIVGFGLPNSTGGVNYAWDATMSSTGGVFFVDVQLRGSSGAVGSTEQVIIEIAFQHTLTR